MHRPAPLTNCEWMHLPLHEDPSYNVTELPCRVEQRTHNTEYVPREHSLLPLTSLQAAFGEQQKLHLFQLCQFPFAMAYIKD